MRDNNKIKQRFSHKEIEKIRNEAMEKDFSIPVRPVLSEHEKKIHKAFEDYLDEYDTNTFHWAYELGYAAAVHDMRKAGVAV